MLRWVSVAFVAVLAAICGTIAHAEAESRIALVIGNSSYVRFPVLANPANDARAMAEVLTAAGFQLYGRRPIIDGDRETILKAIRGFGSDLKKGMVGLFYYAGHGVQIDGINYLLPINAKIEKRSDVRWELVNVSDLLEEIQDAGNQLNIIILDACRNNPIGEPGMRGIAGTGLAQMTAPRGAFIAYATAPGKFAEDGKGEHSPYTAALLETFKVPGLTLFEAFNRVALQVRERTYDVQEPWNAYSGISGDFYMLPPVKPEAPTTGIITLEVAPENSVLRLDGQPAGRANGFRKEVPAGTHEYEIAADGYESRHGTLTVPAGGEKSVVVALTGMTKAPPTPPPRTTGTLELEVATPGVMLKLDGKDLGPAKGFRQEVAAGRHEIVLSAEGFEPQRQTVSLPAGGDKSLVIALAPVPAAPPPPPAPTTGLLELHVSTPGATVRLDGKPMGLAKGFRRELPIGQHELEILADGYEPAKQPVTIAPGIERSVMIALTAIPKPAAVPPTAAPMPNDRGVLTISADPGTATILVDGIRQPRPGSAQLEVAPGEHLIAATGKGLVQQQLKVQVGAGERVQVPLQLARIPPPQPRAAAQPRAPARREEPPTYAPVASRPVESPSYQPPPAVAPAYRPPAVAAPPQQAPAPPSPSAKCFTFQGKQFCE